MRLRSWLLGFVIGALWIAPAEGQRQCVKGKPCGNTCIAANRTCRVGTPKASPSKALPLVTQDTAAVPDTSAKWVASRRGSVYYRIGCSGANQLVARNRVYFKSEGDAKAAGYTRSRTRGC